MHGHLVTVKVGIECGAYQRMQLDGLAFDQHRLKGLDTQTVQGGRTVQHHRVFANDFLQDIPDLRSFAFDQLLCRLDGGRQPPQLQLAEDKRFEQLERHALRQATLVQHQRRAYYNHGTA